MQFMLYSNGTTTGAMWSLDEMFQYKIRFHVLVQTQDELETLQGYMLMYGRKLEVSFYKDWQRSQRTDKPIILPPLVFTTVIPDSDQYGL